MNDNFNEIKYKNNYTNNNVDLKCELSLSGEIVNIKKEII